MNISQMFRNFANNNLQQLHGNNRQVQSNNQVNNQQPEQSRVQSQNQRDQYIHQEGSMAQDSAGIYSPSGMSQARQMPQSASGQFIERDNEAVSFNPYTFNPQAMNEAKPNEAPNQSERPEGMPENGELSGEMPDLPPIPEGEEFSGELPQDLPERPEGEMPHARREDGEFGQVPPELPKGEEFGSMPPAKPEDSESESESEQGFMTAQRPGDMRKPGGSGGPVPVSGSDDEDSDSDTSNDSEIQKLEQERTQLTQKLNTERDDNKKASLRVELQAVESQIMQLKTQAA